jgi:hypothetical protein
MDPLLLWRLVAWGFSYFLIVLLSYLTLTDKVQGWKVPLFLTALVLNQIFLKVVYRFFIPGFHERAGDELFWLAEMRKYQVTGDVPTSRIAQGPGIFLLTRLFSPIFSGDYCQTLIAISLVFGSIYILPLFALQRNATGSCNLALLATAISSQFDVILYSTTIARPTLIGLFLLPLLVYLFVEYRKRVKASFLAAFTLLALILLFIHAPITYAVLLIIVFVVWIALGFKALLEKVSAILLFGIYGFTLKLAIPDLYRILTDELLAHMPFARLNFFQLLFFAPPAFLIFFDSLRSWVASRLKLNVSLVGLIAYRRTLAAPLISLLVMFALLVYWKYGGYISLVYGGFRLFLALHWWKIPMAIIALYGLSKTVAKPMVDGVRVTVAWLLSMMLVVFFLLAYAPYQRYPGLYNLDERFFEFTIFPAAAFIAYGLSGLWERMSGQFNRLLLIAFFSAYTIPSIIVGMRDPLLI